MKATPVGICGKATATQNEVVQTGTEDKVDTACLGCVFAIGAWIEKEEKGKKGQPIHKFVQSSDIAKACYMCKLQRFKQLNVNIEEMEDRQQNEFYVIHGRVCPFYRPQIWKKKDETLGEAFDRANDEVVIKADVVVYADQNDDPQAILDTYESFGQAEIKPQRIYIANNNCCTPSFIMKNMRGRKLPWRVENISEGGADLGRSLDLIMRKCQSTFVVCVRAGTKLAPSFLEYIDLSLFIELDRFLVLVPEDNQFDGLVIHRPFYKQLGGNAGDSFLEKAQRIAEDQECQHLIKPLNKIVNQPFVSLSHVTTTVDMLKPQYKASETNTIPT